MLYFIIEHPTQDIVWHIGEPIPEIVFKQRVLTIQADGDELEQILEALKGEYKKWTSTSKP